MALIARRDLLKLAGAAGLAGCSPEYPGPKPAGPLARGAERWVRSACGQCPAGCGIRVRALGHRAVKIEGDPESPVNRGSIGPKGQSGLQVLYHPDRVRSPLKRQGPRGAGQWEPVTWDEAIDELAAKLRELRARAPHELVVVDGEARGVRNDLWQRFLDAFGSPNHLVHGWSRFATEALAMAYMGGEHELPAFDWPSTRYVLGFGAGFFESWCQTIHLMRTSSEMRGGTLGRRVKLVQVSSRFSVTAAKTDEWIPIAPETHGALALGLAHVLVRDGLYDEAFVEGRTFGFEDWTDADGNARRGFKDLVLTDYTPEKVAAVTQVQPETIERLAREVRENAPAIAVVDSEADEATNGLGTVMAVYALNALLGNLDRPGGMVVPRRLPLTPWEDVALDDVARAGLAAGRIDGAGTAACPLGRERVHELPAAILAGAPYPVGALVFSGANPVFTSFDASRWEEALARVPLVVSCASFPDETTLWADLVLPDPTYLERWEVCVPAPNDGPPMLVQRRPVVEPLHDTLSTGELVLRLAKACGAPVADAFPWSDERAAVAARVEGVGGLPGSSIQASSGAAFLEELESAGSWRASPGEEGAAFATPSGRFELFARAIDSRLAEAMPGDLARRDALCLPHWEPASHVGDAGEYPHLLLPVRRIDTMDGGSRHVSGLRELPRSGNWAWQERIELAPEHARALGVTDGDTVQVESAAGTRRALCVEVSPGVRPGTVGLPLGAGPWPPRPGALLTSEGLGLLAELAAPLSGVPARQGTRVRVWKEVT